MEEFLEASNSLVYVISNFLSISLSSLPRAKHSARLFSHTHTDTHTAVMYREAEGFYLSLNVRLSFAFNKISSGNLKGQLSRLRRFFP